MAEKLVSPNGVNLIGKRVQLHQAVLREGLKAEECRFDCRGGFGCDPSAMGRKVFGLFCDGEEAYIYRGDIQFVVEEGE